MSGTAGHLGAVAYKAEGHPNVVAYRAEGHPNVVAYRAECHPNVVAYRAEGHPNVVAYKAEGHPNVVAYRFVGPGGDRAGWELNRGDAEFRTEARGGRGCGCPRVGRRNRGGCRERPRGRGR